MAAAGDDRVFLLTQKKENDHLASVHLSSVNVGEGPTDAQRRVLAEAIAAPHCPLPMDSADRGQCVAPLQRWLPAAIAAWKNAAIVAMVREDTPTATYVRECVEWRPVPVPAGRLIHGSGPPQRKCVRYGGWSDGSPPGALQRTLVINGQSFASILPPERRDRVDMKVDPAGTIHMTWAERHRGQGQTLRYVRLVRSDATAK